MRVVDLLVFPSVQVLDVTGPLQVFTTANEQVTECGGPAPYALRVVARGGQSVTSSAGVALSVTALPPIASPIDTLIVAGGPGVEAAATDSEL
ncbi:MAG TPA: GlxA family transcriptional regulator, partial [Reyranella sp.]